MNGSIAGTKKGKIHKITEEGKPLCGARNQRGTRGSQAKLGFFPTHIQADLGEVNCRKCADALNGYTLLKTRIGHAPVD